MKKIILFLLIFIMIFSFSACGSIDTAKDMLKDYLEQYEPIEDTDIEEDKYDDEFLDEDDEDDGNIVDGDNEPMYFANYNSFEVTFKKNDKSQFVCMPTTYFSVFDDGYNDVKTLTKVPDTIQPQELIEVEIELFGEKTKAKIFNFYHDEVISKDDATLSYIEYKIKNNMDFNFVCDLTEESTKEEFYKSFGTPNYENAKNTTVVVCYRVPAADLGDFDGFLELTFDKDTDKLIEFKYGLFTPEYIN